MLGADAEFTVDWGSLYTFQCRRLEWFRERLMLLLANQVGDDSAVLQAIAEVAKGLQG